MRQLLVASLGLSLLTAPALAADVRVIDGDTVDIDRVRVRIIDIDTPETWRARCDREYQLGQKATVRLSALLANRTVTHTVEGRDRWNRVLGRVYADGVDVGAVLLKEGLALPYVKGADAKARRLAAWCP